MILSTLKSGSARGVSPRRETERIRASLRRRVQEVHRLEQRPGLPQRPKPAAKDVADGARPIRLCQRAIHREAEGRITSHHQSVWIERKVVLDQRVLGV